jgi:Na+/melibiose symporter-like transporter
LVLQDISLILTLMGTIAVVLFHFSLWFANPIDPESLENQPLVNSDSEEKVNFFKRLDFYQNGILYVVGRICFSAVMVFLPKWLSEIPSSMGGKKENIATVPLVSFVASFVASIVFKQSYQFVGGKIGYLAGCVFGLVGCFWIFFEQQHDEWELYMLAMLLGVGHSLLVIASLNMTADMIGKHTAQGGVVYSAIAVFDKVITGIIIFFIEST